MLNKKKVFPVAHALDQAPLRQGRDLGTLLSKPALEPPDLERVIAVLDALDARASAQQVAQRLHDEAISHLKTAKLTLPGREDLREVARWLALREETP